MFRCPSCFKLKCVGNPIRIRYPISSDVNGDIIDTFLEREMLKITLSVIAIFQFTTLEDNLSKGWIMLSELQWNELYVEANQLVLTFICW